jgi:hypothetical protein
MLGYIDRYIPCSREISRCLWILGFLCASLMIPASQTVGLQSSVSRSKEISYNNGTFQKFCHGYKTNDLQNVDSDLVTLTWDRSKIELPILMVCGHSGPCSDMKWLLIHGLGVSQDDVDVYGYYYGSKSTAFNDKRKKHQSMLASLSKSFYQWTNLSVALLDSYSKVTSIYPTIICEFPGNQCLNFQYSANKLLIRFSHRWYHHTLWHEGAQIFQQRLIKNSSRIRIAANNPFDKEFTKHYLSIDPHCIPSMYGDLMHLQYKPKHEHDVMLLPHHGGGNDSEYIPYFMEEFASHRFKLQYASSKLSRRFEYADLIRWKQAFVLPYALHTSSINEAYVLGIPLVIPSIAYAYQLHRSLRKSTNCGVYTCGLFTHAHIGNGPSSLKILPAKARPCDILHNDSFTCVSHWLSYVDFYLFPDVWIVGSMDEAVKAIQHISKLSSKKLAVRSTKVKAWSKNILQGSIASLYQALI